MRMTRERLACIHDIGQSMSHPGVVPECAAEIDALMDEIDALTARVTSLNLAGETLFGSMRRVQRERDALIALIASR